MLLLLISWTVGHLELKAVKIPTQQKSYIVKRNMQSHRFKVADKDGLFCVDSDNVVGGERMPSNAFLRQHCCITQYYTVLMKNSRFPHALGVCNISSPYHPIPPFTADPPSAHPISKNIHHMICSFRRVAPLSATTIEGIPSVSCR